MKNNDGNKPAFLPIFNRKKRPRQALLAHPNNTSDIGAKQCKIPNSGQSTHKYQQSSQPAIQKESPSMSNYGNSGYQGNKSYQGNAGYQGNSGYQGNEGYQRNVGFQGGYQGNTGCHGNNSYQGNRGVSCNSGQPYSQSSQKHFIKTETPTTSTNKSNTRRLTQQQLPTTYKPGGLTGGSDTGGGMQGGSSKPHQAAYQQQEQMYPRQQPSNRASNVLKQRTFNNSVTKTTSNQWQLGGIAPSQDPQSNRTQYSSQAGQTRAQPAKLEVTKTTERMGAGNEHLAKETLRFITASIQSVRHWTKYKQQFKIIFEIYAQLDSTVSADVSRNAKTFTLKDSKSTVKCIFYETDRPLSKFTRGQWLRCIGTLDEMKDTFRCVQVRRATQDEQRMRAVRMSAASKALGSVLTSVEQ